MPCRDDDEADEEGIGRDVLGEMEIAARIMITGGDEREDARMTRADRLLIRNAIFLAAKTVKETGREQVLTQDVVDALQSIGHDETSTGSPAQPGHRDGGRHGAVLLRVGRTFLQPPRHPLAAGGCDHSGDGHPRPRRLRGPAHRGLHLHDEPHQRSGGTATTRCPAHAGGDR